LIWPKIQQFGKTEVLEIHRLAAQIPEAHEAILTRLRPVVGSVRVSEPRAC